MRTVLLALVVVACGGSPEPEPVPVPPPAAVSEGGAAEPEALAVYTPANPDPNLEQPQDPDAEAERREDYEALCGGIVLVPGMPPEPPPTPAEPSLRALEATYTNSLMAMPPLPSARTLAAYNEWARTTFAQWAGEYGPKVRALQQGVTALDPANRGVGIAWLAHSYGVYAEGLESVPPPEEIEADPVLLAIFRGAFYDQVRPLLDQALTALRSARLSGDWGAYDVRLRGWIRQQQCALHPSR